MGRIPKGLMEAAQHLPAENANALLKTPMLSPLTLLDL
ncbi:hypothetical protein Z949_564 [Sulfitobacter guttiformis KCTC 32187]|nr:hypothetical protein Z949_564 [Sulfitobacter guttiformis KCTC 32187]